MQYKHKLRKELPKIYSQDLINNLFRHPYTKIDFIMTDLRVSRLTATKYLDKLVEIQLVHKQKIGRVIIPDKLYHLFRGKVCHLI